MYPSPSPTQNDSVTSNNTKRVTESNKFCFSEQCSDSRTATVKQTIGKNKQSSGQDETEVKKTKNDAELSYCEDCNTIITKTVAALQCDNCESEGAWKCLNCLGISNDLYQELINNKDLKWFCHECEL